jgi:hypothetical protein
VTSRSAGWCSGEGARLFNRMGSLHENVGGVMSKKTNETEWVGVDPLRSGGHRVNAPLASRGRAVL